MRNFRKNNDIILKLFRKLVNMCGYGYTLRTKWISCDSVPRATWRVGKLISCLQSIKNMSSHPFDPILCRSFGRITCISMYMYIHNYVHVQSIHDFVRFIELWLQWALFVCHIPVQFEWTHMVKLNAYCIILDIYIISSLDISIT